jgi:hypothetical protein
VHCRPPDERIDAHAEPRSGVDLPVHRLAQRHGAERRVEAFGLGARDVDAVNLPLEGAGIRRQAIGDEGAADCRTGMNAR